MQRFRSASVDRDPAGQPLDGQRLLSFDARPVVIVGCDDNGRACLSGVKIHGYIVEVR